MIEDLIKAYQETKDIEIRNTIIMMSMNIIEITSRKMKKTCYSYTIEELKSFAIDGIIKAIQLYNESFNMSFKGFAFIKIRGAILDNIEKEIHKKRKTSIQYESLYYNAINESTYKYNYERADERINIQNDIETKNILEKINNIINKNLKEMEKKAIILYYYEDISEQDIGDVLGVSESRVCQLIKSGINKIRNYMNIL